MKKSKQVLSILLAVLMLALSVPFAAADDVVEIGGQCGENVFWKLDDQGKLTIFGKGEMAFYYVVEQGEESFAKYYPNWNYEKYKNQISVVEIQDGVTSITDGAFYQFENLKSITIPNSITRIGMAAFLDCVLLEGIVFPDGLKRIEENVFANCYKLTEISIPSTVEYIGEGAFESCQGLQSITVATDNQYYTSENGILFDKAKTELLHCPGTKITVIIPNGVTYIGHTAFDGCRDLKSVTIPSSVRIIGNAAFDGCKSLATVTIPEGVLGLGWSAFYDCDSLTAINIPSTLTNIGDRAFDACDNLLAIDVAEDNPAYSSFDGVLYNKDMTSLIQCPGAKTELTIPDSITSLDDDTVFSNCNALIRITIPKSVTNIYDEHTSGAIFDSCESLRDIDVASDNPVYSSDNGILYNKERTALIICPKGKTEATILPSVCTIEDSAFSNCSLLTQLCIPNSVTNIGAHAFSESGLTSITIPGSVKTIEEYAFYGCRQLKAAVLENGVETIGGWAFRLCESLQSIEISDTVTEIGYYAFGECKNMESIEVSSGNDVFSSANGVLFNKDKTTLIQCPSAKKDIDIPDCVTSIGAAAFRECDYLKTVVIPDSVTLIDSWAFDACDNLISIVLPDSVVNVGSGAFAYCDNLRSVTLSNQMKSIPFRMVVGCPKLKRITIPKSITKIEELSFYLCESLSDIYYLGSEEDWNQIRIATSNEEDTVNNWNEPLFRATIHYNWDPMKLENQVQNVSVLYPAAAFDNTDVSLNVESIDLQNENARAWEIKPVDEEGNIAQPNQPVQIRLPLPAGWNQKTLLITHIHDDGQREIIRDYDLDGQYVTFWVSRFSTFTVAVQEEEPPHEHTYNDGVVTTPATCTAPGVMTYTCVDGDDSYTEEIPALGHVDDDNNGLCDRCEQQMEGGDHCPQCGKIHNGGFFDKLTGFFHKIIYRLTHLFQH